MLHFSERTATRLCGVNRTHTVQLVSLRPHVQPAMIFIGHGFNALTSRTSVNGSVTLLVITSVTTFMNQTDI